MSSLVLMGITCPEFELRHQAQQLASRFDLPLINDLPKTLPSEHFVLSVTEKGLVLQATGKKAPGDIWVDFVGGSNAHRRQFGGGKGQMIAKAVGIKGAYRPEVLDLTAGLGQDGFVLATLGCSVTWLERSMVVYELLKDGVQRAQLSTDPELQNILSRVCVFHQNSVNYLHQQDTNVDVIYLDPMFPEKNSKAEVNKNMKAFHALVGKDDDAGELLSVALTKATYRVVVKRPRKAPSLAQQYPEYTLPEASLVLEGKSTRYDIYPLKKMP